MVALIRARRFLWFSLLLAAALGVSAQSVKTVLSPNPVGANDNISLTLEVAAPSSNAVDLSRVVFPEGVYVRRGPYLRPYTESDGAGGKIPHVRITYTLRSRQTGRMALGPLELVVEGKPRYTEELLLEVGTYRNRELSIPLEVEWTSSGDFFYQGQAVPLVLMVNRQREIGLVDSLSVTPPGSGLFEEAPEIGEISVSEIGGVPLYDVPAASYLYTPANPGSLSLRGGTVTIGDVSGTSERFVLDVLPMPSEVSSTGAVGRFTLLGEPGMELPRQGGVFQYTLRVTGSGNLNYLHIPDLTVEGGTILSSEEDGDYRAGADGYEGYRLRTFTIQVGNAEHLVITHPEFPSINGRTGSISLQPSSTRSFDVLSAPVSGEKESDPEAFPRPNDPAPSVLPLLDVRTRPVLWLVFLPGPLGFLIVFMVRRKRSRRSSTLAMILFFISFTLGAQDSGPEEILRQGSALLVGGEYAAAEDLLSQSPPEPWLGEWHHIRGLIAARQENWDEAVWHLRSAVDAFPLASSYRESLRFVEDKAFIQDAYPAPPVFDWRLMLLLLAVSVNLAACTGIWLLIRPNGTVAILLILFLSATLIFGVFAGAAFIQDGRIYAVVAAGDEGDEVFLKRIPRENGADWFLLAPGTCLRVNEQVDDYYLVENGAGVTGWIQGEALLFVGDGDE